MRALALVAVALAFGSSALAAAPQGFYRSEQLTPRASRIAGVTAAVFCARDGPAWAAFMRASGLGSFGAEIYGLTSLRRRETFLAPQICARLEGWLGGRAIGLSALADALFTFTHETGHLHGIEGECAADRWAVGRLERVARTEFGIRNKARLRALVRMARESAGYIDTC